MKRMFTYLIGAIIILSSCNNANTNKDGNAPATDANTGKNPKGRLEQEYEKNKTEVNNESAFLLLKTTPQYSIWFSFIKRSQYGKLVANNSYTILAPSNDIIKQMNVELLTKVRSENGQKELDALVADYILKEDFKIEKIGELKEVTTITGKKLLVQSGAQNIGGAIYTMNQMFTPMGSVINLSAMMPNAR